MFGKTLEKNLDSSAARDLLRRSSKQRQTVQAGTLSRRHVADINYGIFSGKIGGAQVPVGCCINNSVSEHLAASPRELSVRRAVIALFIAIITATTYVRVRSYVLLASLQTWGRVRDGWNIGTILLFPRARTWHSAPLVYGRNTRKVDDTPRYDPYLYFVIGRSILIEARNSGLVSLIYQRYVSK